ncbi:hypothetical protein BD410DRAFT_809873 [Rickenella mellea]|uniref:Uncharacterized protein n=1 Tax=Rickenella mellea TaxID=50990 RepID=A0A4Y7PIM6_9AGAM|nr:hypothetical protein BD410DRAFT_809873 [Rickenella mellea]
MYLKECGMNLGQREVGRQVGVRREYRRQTVEQLGLYLELGARRTLTGYPYPRILPTGIFNKFRLIVAFRTQNILLHHELPMGTHTGKTLMGNLDPWIRVLQIKAEHESGIPGDLTGMDPWETRGYGSQWIEEVLVWWWWPCAYIRGDGDEVEEMVVLWWAWLSTHVKQACWRANTGNGGGCGGDGGGGSDHGCPRTSIGRDCVPVRGDGGGDGRGHGVVVAAVVHAWRTGTFARSCAEIEEVVVVVVVVALHTRRTGSFVRLCVKMEEEELVVVAVSWLLRLFVHVELWWWCRRCLCMSNWRVCAPRVTMEEEEEELVVHVELGDGGGGGGNFASSLGGCWVTRFAVLGYCGCLTNVIGGLPSPMPWYPRSSPPGDLHLQSHPSKPEMATKIEDFDSQHPLGCFRDVADGRMGVDGDERPTTWLLMER